MHHDSVADELRSGWLTFSAGAERRRLAPIPRRWESMKEDRLRLALGAAAAVVQQHLSPLLASDDARERVRDRASSDEPPRAEPAP